MNKNELNALADKVDALDGPDREVDEAIERAMHPEWDDDDCAFDHPMPYTASLDAAMLLVPEGWAIRFNLYPKAHWRSRAALHPPSKTAPAINEDFDVQAIAPTPALALVAACLRAHAEGVE